MVPIHIASMIMSSIQDTKVKDIECLGYFYPTLVIINEKSLVLVDDLRVRYPNILEVSYQSTNNISFTLLTLKNEDEKDDGFSKALREEISFRHRPDAFGYLTRCWYKSIPKRKYKANKKASIKDDPEAINVIHNCFYTKEGDPKGYLMVTPYLVKEAHQKKPNFYLGDDTVEYTTLLFYKYWEVSSDTLWPKITNPYLL